MSMVCANKERQVLWDEIALSAQGPEGDRFKSNIGKESCILHRVMLYETFMIRHLSCLCYSFCRTKGEEI